MIHHLQAHWVRTMDCCWMDGRGGGMAVPTPRMYLEGARHLLNDDGDADADPKGGGEDGNNNNAVLQSALEAVDSACPCI